MQVERVMERVEDRRRRPQAGQSVQQKAGAAGIDQRTVEDFAQRAEELLALSQAKVQAGTYRFKPARRVEIPKPGSTKKRHLGLPGVMDRIVSHSLHSGLEELFEPECTSSNCGLRRGKSQPQAIGYGRQAVVEGYEGCAAIDLQGFFDEIPQDLILKLIRRKIRDERVGTLIARALRAGVRVDGVLEKTVKGGPQGSPVSPMLSNIVLNELDHALEGRGHRYCRWTEDFLLLRKTERAARRVMESMTHVLEQSRGLPVHRDKSQVALVKDVEFLGYQMLRGQMRISPKARQRFKDQVRRRTPRNHGQAMSQSIHDLNEYLRGGGGTSASKNSAGYSGSGRNSCAVGFAPGNSRNGSSRGSSSA